MPRTLTRYLLDLFPSQYTSATMHPFLKAAGARTLSAELLASWLTQDYFYIQGYVKLIGLLVSRIDQGPVHLRRRILRLLTGALQNIEREQMFFEEVAAKHELSLETPPFGPENAAITLIHPNTKSYVDFMAATGAIGSLEEGLVLLWATEQCYFGAWKYASQQKRVVAVRGNVPDALDELVENWTNDEFGVFVEDLAQLVNGLGISLDEGTRLDAAKSIVQHVLYLEKSFWPSGSASYVA